MAATRSPGEQAEEDSGKRERRRIRPPERAALRREAQTEEEARQDIEDLKRARASSGGASDKEPIWKQVGPGLVTGAADDDPTAVGTYSVAGAEFGYGLLWGIVFNIPLMIAIQEMCGRIGAVTGNGLASAVKKRYHPAILWGTISLLLIANIINIWADLNAMAASVRMLFGLPLSLWLAIITAVSLGLQIFVPYRVYVGYLKWLALALLSYVVVAFFPGVHVHWGRVLAHLFVPHWTDSPQFVLTLVAFFGTSISPYLFFWQAGETVEEEVESGKASRPGERKGKVSAAELRTLRADTAIGMSASQIVCLFIMITATATLHDRGQTDVNTARDAARALLPLGGHVAYALFTLGMLAAGLLAVPTLAGSCAYAVSEALGWRYGLYRRFSRARNFYLTLAGTTLIGFGLNFLHAFKPMKGLLYSAAINGIMAPPLIALLMLLCNDPSIVGDRRNGWLSNAIGVIAVLVMAAGAAVTIWGLATGKAG